MKQDKMHGFWEKYVNADMLERDEMLKKLVKFGIWQDLFKIQKIKSKKVGGLTLQEFALKTNLMSYFDDLIEYMQSR
jgi:hypothetical protein